MRGHVEDLLRHFSGLSSDLAVGKLDLAQALLQYAALVLTHLQPHAALDVVRLIVTIRERCLSPHAVSMLCPQIKSRAVLADSLGLYRTTAHQSGFARLLLWEHDL